MTRGVRTLHVVEHIKGGIATYLRLLLHEQEADHDLSDFRVVVPEEEATHLGTVARHKLSTYRFPERGIGGLAALAHATAREAIRFRPHIVFVHSSFPGAIGRPLVALLRVLSLSRARVVYCPHGVAFAMDTGGVRRAFYRSVERTLSSLCDRIICISQHEFDLLVSAGVPAQKCSVIYNGIPVTPPEAEPLQLPAIVRDARDRGDFILAFVGRYDRQKGLDVLLEAMRLLAGKPVVLVCAGSPVHAERAPTFPPNAVDLGWLSPGQLTTLLAHCDALVVPSRWEGFGLVVVEAMRSARAVFVSGNGALPELVLEGVTGTVVASLTPRHLANALTSLPRAVLAQYGVAGRERFMREFSAARMSSRLREVLLQVAE